MDEREEDPYGYIYRATNVVNGKVYIGQTISNRGKGNRDPIGERWKQEVRETYNRVDRGENLRYVESAIMKYGPENFELTQQDIAHSQEELDRKEVENIRDYDSMNPDKGYNLMEGGRGGRMSEIAKEKMSRSGSEKWNNDPEYSEKQTKERQERAEKNPEWHQKMVKINQELARNPKVQEKMSKVLTEKWKGAKYQESVSKGVTEKWKDEKYRERQARAKAEGKREIPDKEQFLKDIKDMMKKDINTKYDMDGKSINKRIGDMLGHQGVRTYSEAKKYLEDKNLKDVLKDIEEKTKEKDAKPSSQGDSKQDKGESKPQEKSKETPEGEPKKDEKESIKESSKEDDKGTNPEKEVEVSDKDEKQEKNEEAKGEDGKSEEKISEEPKQDDQVSEEPQPDEKDYKGIDEGISGEGDSEKKSDIGGVFETSSIRGSDIRIGNFIRETIHTKPEKGDKGSINIKDTRFTSGVDVIDNKAPISPKPTGREGKHPDLSGLNLNLSMGSDGGDFGLAGGGGGGGGGSGGGGEALDYNTIDEDAKEAGENTEKEGEGGSEGREYSYEF